MESRNKTITEGWVVQSDGEGPPFSFLSSVVAGSAGGRRCVSRRQLIGSALLATAGAVFSRASEPSRWQIG